MPDTPPPAAPAVPSALAAFLRGIERRAYVFAQVQCGNEREAEAALARTIHGFRTLSAVSPLSAWPAGFWSLLLAQPELSTGDGGAPELVTLGSGPRAALLLRLVAGLDFVHAAQVLGVSEDTYRYALQRALQQLGEAGVSYATLRALRERLHRQVKTLPAERTDALAALRQHALARSAAEPVDAGPEAGPAAPWVRRTLWVLFALLALAFAATFVDPGPGLAPGGTEGLPAEGVAPADGTPSPSDVVMHPDYAQLADPEGDRVAQDLALLSWLANNPEELADAALADEADGEAADPPGTAPGAGAAGAPDGTAPVEEDADAR
jgi:hypothetical protein